MGGMEIEGAREKNDGFPSEGDANRSALNQTV